MWIDTGDELWMADDEIEVGRTYYLVRRVYNGSTRYELRTDVPRANMSHQPVERGWLGETNNVSRTALGRVRVAKLGRTKVLVTRGGA